MWEDLVDKRLSGVGRPTRTHPREAGLGCRRNLAELEPAGGPEAQQGFCFSPGLGVCPDFPQGMAVTRKGNRTLTLSSPELLPVMVFIAAAERS